MSKSGKAKMAPCADGLVLIQEREDVGEVWVCAICDKAFRRERFVTAHIEKTHWMLGEKCRQYGDRWSCSVCKKQFTTKLYVYLHIDRKHVGGTKKKKSGTRSEPRKKRSGASGVAWQAVKTSDSGIAGVAWVDDDSALDEDTPPIITHITPTQTSAEPGRDSLQGTKGPAKMNSLTSALGGRVREAQTTAGGAAASASSELGRVSARLDLKPTKKGVRIGFKGGSSRKARKRDPAQDEGQSTTKTPAVAPKPLPGQPPVTPMPTPTALPTPVSAVPVPTPIPVSVPAPQVIGRCLPEAVVPAQLGTIAAEQDVWEFLGHEDTPASPAMPMEQAGPCPLGDPDLAAESTRSSVQGSIWPAVHSGTLTVERAGKRDAAQDEMPSTTPGGGHKTPAIAPKPLPAARGQPPVTHMPTPTALPTPVGAVPVPTPVPVSVPAPQVIGRCLPEAVVPAQSGTIAAEQDVWEFLGHEDTPASPAMPMEKAGPCPLDDPDMEAESTRLSRGASIGVVTDSEALKIEQAIAVALSGAQWVIPSEQVLLASKLGRGGYGQVYQGTHLGSPVAVKELRPEGKTFSPEELKAATREVEFLCGATHKHIVEGRGASFTPSKVQIVMELAKGTLRDWQKYVDSLAEKLNALMEIALGLAFLHSRVPVVIHRDLKPDNILWAEDGTMKICDFGHARAHDIARSLHTLHCGTYQYMPPEAYDEAEAVTTKFDIYAFGVIAWELILDRVAFENINQMQHLLAVADPSFTGLPTAEVRSPELRELIAQCLSPSPGLRPSIDEIVRALDRCVEDVRRNEVAGELLIPPETISTHSEEPIGEGKDCVVHSAMYEGQKVALKVPKDDVALGGLCEEFKLVRHIGRHLHVAHVIGITRFKGKPSAVLPYYEGGSLDKILDAARLSGVLLPLDRKLRWLLGISKGPPLWVHRCMGITRVCSSFPPGSMQVLCAAKVLHRDLATRNVLIGAGDVAAVADFGLSRLSNSGNTYYRSDAGSKTLLPYMWTAPEGWISRKASTATEVYSFGIMAWEVCTQITENPFQHLKCNAWGVIDAIKSGKRPRIHVEYPHACALHDFLNRCWAHDPKGRFSSFQELREELEAITMSLHGR